LENWRRRTLGPNVDFRLSWLFNNAGPVELSGEKEEEKKRNLSLSGWRHCLVSKVVLERE